MITFILVLSILSTTQHNAVVTSIPGFWSEAQCQAAGVASQSLVKDINHKHVRFVCLRQGGAQ